MNTQHHKSAEADGAFFYLICAMMIEISSKSVDEVAF